MNLKTLAVSKPIVALAALATIGAGAGMTAIASAQTPSASSSSTQVTSATADHPMMQGMRGFGHGGRGHGVAGTVSAVNGNTLTITKDDGITYTVDATNAKVSKVVELTVADIKVGDRIGAQGDVSGTTITAKHIMDGIPAKPAGAPAQTTTN